MRNIDRVRAAIAEQGADAMLLSHPPTLRWACGFTGSNGLLIVRAGAAHFITDGRYQTQAEAEVEGAAQGIEVHAPGYDLIGHAAEEELFGAARTVLFQAKRVSVARIETWGDKLPEIDWQPGDDLLAPLVAAKSDEEIARVQAAQSLTCAIFEEVCDFLKPGCTEREVAAQIVYRHLQRGAERMAFDPIVASGPNSALPHARATGREISTGELVLIDMGGVVEGYVADLTRTVAVGDPGAEAQAVYDLVREAQKAALEAAQSGMTGEALDAAAREVIEEAGHGEHFPHSLGHGVGLEPHEWPRVSSRAEDDVLPEGATVTIEPGVYLPGQFGVRIEDVVTLESDGCESVTDAPRELVVV